MMTKSAVDALGFCNQDSIAGCRGHCIYILLTETSFTLNTNAKKQFCIVLSKYDPATIKPVALETL